MTNERTLKKLALGQRSVTLTESDGAFRDRYTVTRVEGGEEHVLIQTNRQDTAEQWFNSACITMLTQ